MTSQNATASVSDEDRLRNRGGILAKLERMKKTAKMAERKITEWEAASGQTLKVLQLFETIGAHSPNRYMELSISIALLANGKHNWSESNRKQKREGKRLKVKSNTSLGMVLCR